MNEMSFESIYNAGLGLSVAKTSDESASVERYDGFLTGLLADVTKSEEDLNFIELYGKVEDANTAGKIKMLEKINKNYGKCHRAIENYCRSCEAEVDGTSALKENNDSASDAKKAEAGKKKTNVLINVLRAIGDFFVKIWNTIVKFFRTIAAKVKAMIQKRKDAKTKANLEKEAAKTSADAIKKIENYEKCMDLVTNNLGTVEGIVAKLKRRVDSATKKLSSWKVETSKAGVEGGVDIYTVNASYVIVINSAMKLFVNLGKIVMKAASVIQSASDFDTIMNTVKGFSTPAFNEFVAKYKMTVEKLNPIFDKIESGKTKDTDMNEVSKSAYAVYTDVAEMMQTYVGFKATPASQDTFRFKAGKVDEMKAAIDRMIEAFGEQTTKPLTLKMTIKKLFGIEIDVEKIKKNS